MLNQSSVSVSHKDIAARQAGSSIFPWQQDQAHSRQSQDGMETPLKRRGASLWDALEETPIKSSQRMSSTRAAQSPCGSSQQMEQLKTLNQGRLFTLDWEIIYFIVLVVSFHFAHVQPLKDVFSEVKLLS